VWVKWVSPESSTEAVGVVGEKSLATIV